MERAVVLIQQPLQALVRDPSKWSGVVFRDGEQPGVGQAVQPQRAVGKGLVTLAVFSPPRTNGEQGRENPIPHLEKENLMPLLISREVPQGKGAERAGLASGEDVERWGRI